MISSHSEYVWKVLSSMPIEVYDDTNYSVWENELWELVTPRFEGDYVGRRTIGSANIITAYNLLHLKLLAESEQQDSYELFRSCLDDLVRHNLIRRSPSAVRKGFRTV